MGLALKEFLTAENWAKKLDFSFGMPYFVDLENFLANEIASGKTIFPPLPLVFSAFNLCDFDQIKVVIIGQDPYHQPGQANGLAFSVLEGQPLPPSLRNIFKELANDIAAEQQPKGNLNGDLTSWAKQGVLLLNTVLTVVESSPNAHQNKGWETWTDHIIEMISSQKEKVVFILWGKPAEAKLKLIDVQKHFVIQSPHPSPLAAYRGFFGSKPFSKTNNYLKSLGKAIVVW